MTCPHYTPVSPHAGACAMLAPHGISLVAGPANPNYPCPACQAAWPAGTALAVGDPLPEPLVRLAESMRQPEERLDDDEEFQAILRRGCCG